MMRGTHQIVLLVVKSGVQEESVVLELEVLVFFANSALTQGEELFAFGQGSHGYSPFLERNWHRGSQSVLVVATDMCGAERTPAKMIANPAKRNDHTERLRKDQACVTGVTWLCSRNAHQAAAYRPGNPAVGQIEGCLIEVDRNRSLGGVTIGHFEHRSHPHRAVPASHRNQFDLGFRIAVAVPFEVNRIEASAQLFRAAAAVGDRELEGLSAVPDIPASSSASPINPVRISPVIASPAQHHRADLIPPLISGSETERAEHAALTGTRIRPDPELLGNLNRMEWSGATKSEQREVAGIEVAGRLSSPAMPEPSPIGNPNDAPGALFEGPSRAQSRGLPTAFHGRPAELDAAGELGSRFSSNRPSTRLASVTVGLTPPWP